MRLSSGGFVGAAKALRAWIKDKPCPGMAGGLRANASLDHEVGTNMSTTEYRA